jgi:hypothetical protein
MARDTYFGKLIRVSHYIKVKLLTPTMLDNINVKIPVTIGTPPESHVPEDVGIEPSTGTPSATPSAPVAANEVLSGAVEYENARELSIRSAAQLPTIDFPFVEAVPIPADAIEAPMVIQQAYVIGGAPVQVEHGTDEENYQSADLDNLIPLPPPTAPGTATLEDVVEAMLTSVNDYQMISRRMEEWRHVFATLTPSDFGNIIAHVRTSVCVAGVFLAFVVLPLTDISCMLTDAGKQRLGPAPSSRTHCSPCRAIHL